MSLQRKIIEATKAIRKKFSDFKRNEAQAQRTYGITHKQLLDPITAIASATEKQKTLFQTPPPTPTPAPLIKFSPPPSPQLIKLSPHSSPHPIKKSRIKRLLKSDSSSTPYPSSFSSYETPPEKESSDDISDDEDRHFPETSRKFDSLESEYRTLLKDANNPDVDRSCYGLKIARTVWRFGNTRVSVLNNGEILEVSGKRYPGTRGLFNLLTLRDPQDYTNDDLNNYVDIIKSTNTHLVQGRRGNLLKVNLSPKRNLLQAHLSPKKKGGNIKHHLYVLPKLKRLNMFKQFTTRPVDYVYWNKPEELFERLNLLQASYQAGNNSEQNLSEIQSIVEELAEEGYSLK